MTELSYLQSRLDDDSLVEFAKAVDDRYRSKVGKRGGVKRALRATGRKVRGGRTPVKRDLSPPSALGTNQPGRAQPEWMRSYGSPGPKTGW